MSGGTQERRIGAAREGRRGRRAPLRRTNSFRGRIDVSPSVTGAQIYGVIDMPGVSKSPSVRGGACDRNARFIRGGGGSARMGGADRRAGGPGPGARAVPAAL